MRQPAVVIAALVAPLLAACAVIPTSGPIQQGAEVGVEVDRRVNNVGGDLVDGGHPGGCDATVSGQSASCHLGA